MEAAEFKKLDRLARNAFLKKKALEISSLLGDWRFDNLSQNVDRFTLIGDKKAKITFKFSSKNDGMVELVFAWPSVNSWFLCCRGWGVLKDNEQPPYFRFGVTRKSKLVADKLRREILPHYVDLHARCLVAYRVEMEKRAAINVIVDSFKRLASPVSITGDARWPYVHFGRLPGARSCELKINSAGDCDMKLNGISADLALRVLGLCTAGG